VLIDCSPSLPNPTLTSQRQPELPDSGPVQHFLETWGYVAVFFLTLLESACVPIPSEVTLGLGGALASGAVIGNSHGSLNLGLVILVGIAGSVVGSLLAYVVGRTGGRALVDRYGKYVLLSHADLDKAELWFARRGEWMVLYGRVLPFIRTFISLPAGMAEMSVAKFTAFTAIGVTLWVSLLSIIGYALGDSWNKMTKVFGLVGYIVAALVVVAMIGVMIRRYRTASAADRAGPSDRGRIEDSQRPQPDDGDE
jgi:membrane protein DedA with SNARE-associated domain